MAETELSVVLPVFRNERELEALHRRLAAVLARLPYESEILYVNDCSPDRSIEVIERLANRDARVVLVDRPRRGGQHRAVLDGLAQSRGRVIVVLDADGQDPPEAIPQLLHRLEHPGDAPVADAVFAVRRGIYQPLLRMISSRMFKTFLWALSGLPADAGMFFAITAGLASRILAVEPRYPYVSVMVAALARRLVAFPVVRGYSDSSSSAYRSRDRVVAATHALACFGECQLSRLRSRRPGAG